MRFLLSMLMGLAMHSSAEAACAKTYGAGAFGADMTALHKALSADDQGVLAVAGARLAEGLPCTNVVPPVPALASAYRFIGVHHYIAGRKDDGKRFFISALELDPDFDWGVKGLASDAATRAAFEAARAEAVSEPVRVEGKAFMVPQGSAVYIDGRKAKEVEATLDRPHLVQVVSDDKASQTHLIQGNAFPEALMGTAAMAAKGGSGTKGPERVQRLRPPAKTPLLVVGGVGLVAGAGLYAASYATRSSFDSATTTDELMKHQTTTNALVIASGVSVLVGLGTGYAGFMLNGRPGFVYQISY